MGLEEYQDKQLVEMVIDGNAQAFELLLERYREAVMLQLMQLTSGNVIDSDDLLQETFIKVYANIHSYNPDYAFGSWVYTIAKNTFIDFVRKRRDDVSELSENDSTQSQLPTPEESMINSQQRAEIDFYMQALKPAYRKLIELRFIKEFSYEEIASELKLPLGTVKTQIHRAREILSKLLKLE